MSDLSMYEAIASAEIRQCRNDARRLRRAIAEQEKNRVLFQTDEARAGIDLIVRKLQERLAALDAPGEAERGQ